MEALSFSPDWDMGLLVPRRHHSIVLNPFGAIAGGFRGDGLLWGSMKGAEVAGSLRQSRGHLEAHSKH